MALNAAQVREDEKMRIVYRLRAAAGRDDNPLVPPWALLAVADMIAAEPARDPAPIL